MRPKPSDEAFRAAALKKVASVLPQFHPKTPWSAVQRVAGASGAYVDVTIWVSDAEASVEDEA